MIDLTKYPLTYFNKESKEALPARTVGGTHIELVENGEVKKLTIHHARKLYRSCKKNISAKNKPRYQRPKIFRKDGYEEYLNETTAKLVSGLY